MAPMIEISEEQKILIDQLRSGSQVARDSLILKNMDLAGRLAGSFWFNNQRRMDDVRAVALLALVKAVDWAALNLKDYNIQAVINVTVRRQVNDFILYDHTIRCSKSERKKPVVISATCHDDDGNSYEDFTLNHKAYAPPEQSLVLEEFCRRLKLTYKQKTILAMRMEGHNMKSIAQVLRCTAPYVSQMLDGIGQRYNQVNASDGHG